MAKKRKHSTPSKAGPKEIDPRDGQLVVRSYKDVANEEDEFHMNRDEILLEDGPGTKRRRKLEEEDAELELSDEEILGYDEQSSDDEDEDIDDTIDQPLENVDGEDEDAGDWGTSRKDYYNNDQIETEADALEEEAEAKRLQQKKLLKMSEADFGLDEDEWLDTANGDDERDVITEVLKDIEITEDMSSEERLQLLRTRYPEFELLAEDYIRLQPLLGVLRRMEQSRVARIKMQALAAYLASLSMYFAILTSPAQENRNAAAIDPGELRDHGVMESLLRCRELWTSVQDIEFDIEDDVDVLDSASIEEAADSGMQSNMHNSDNLRSTTKSKKTAKLQDASTRAAEVRLARLTAAQDDLAELRNLTGTLSQKKSRSKKPRELQPEDDSDFGEEETLSTREMAEKAQKKKSLRFYTSQIAQKSNRRADAGRDAGGDADLPYRERLKDRQARLNAEAEKRGKKLDQYGRGTALGGDSDEEDLAEAPRERDEDDEYYDMVTKHSSKRKSEKADKYAAIAEAKAANATVRVVDAAIGEDGKRSIGYVIEKNKGLAPKRQKMNNPRVKKRQKYEDKLKKLKSQKQVYSGGEGRGGYGGEKTGIKTGLVKSIKL